MPGQIDQEWEDANDECSSSDDTLRRRERQLMRRGQPIEQRAPRGDSCLISSILLVIALMVALCLYYLFKLCLALFQFLMFLRFLITATAVLAFVNAKINVQEEHDMDSDIEPTQPGERNYDSYTISDEIGACLRPTTIDNHNGLPEMADEGRAPDLSSSTNFPQSEFHGTEELPERETPLSGDTISTATTTSKVCDESYPSSEDSCY